MRVYIQIYERDDRTGFYILKPNTELGESLHLVFFFFPPPHQKPNQVQQWITADFKHSLQN